MHIVALAWIYVVGMASIAEALSPQGTVLGALITFVFWGVLPLVVVLYLMSTPARKKMRRQREAAEAAQAETATPPGRGPAPGDEGAQAAGVDPSLGTATPVEPLVAAAPLPGKPTP